VKTVCIFSSEMGFVMTPSMPRVEAALLGLGVRVGRGGPRTLGAPRGGP